MAKTRKKRGDGLFTFLSGLISSSKTPPTNDVSQPIQPQGQSAETPSLISVDFNPPNNKEYNLLVSHNNRIQSWLDPLLKTQPYFRWTFSIDPKMRFSNGAAISLVFDNTNVNIAMVYPGDASSNKYEVDEKTNKKIYEPYWGLRADNLINIKEFKPFVLTLAIFVETLNINRELIHNLIGKNFLIVRHGEARHNTLKGNMYYDTLLTKLGIEQALTLGRALKESKIQIKKECYVSDLIRTGMTAWAIGTTLFGNETLDKGEISFDRYVVVPCNNEVTNEKGDPKPSSFDVDLMLIQNENKTRCGFTKKCLDKSNCNSCSRCFYFDKLGNPIECPLNRDKSIQKDYLPGAIDLSLKYKFEFYKDFIKNGEKCKNDFFQQLNIVFSSNNPDTSTPKNFVVTPPLNPPSLKDTLSPAPAPGFAPPPPSVAAPTGGSKYKKTKKMKYRKKFSKKGGKKSKVRKTSKKSKK
jgi:hypothetical protein